MLIEDKIRQVLHENSGGMKFIELMTPILTWKVHVMKESIDQSFPDQLESIIGKMKDVKILRYTWHMDDAHLREKMFVYTP